MVSRILYAAVTLAVIGGVAAAQQCATVAASYHGHRQVVKEVVVKKEVVVPVIAPVAVYAVTPAYAAVYVPPVAAAPAMPAPATAPQPSSELQQVLSAINGVNSKVDSIDARLKAVEAKGGGAAVPPPPPDKVDPFAPKPQALTKPQAPATAMLALVGAKCAQCHDDKVSADKGGGFSMVKDGQLLKLDDRQLRKTISLAHLGKMPPRSSNIPAVTDEEVGTIVAWIDSLK